MKVGTRSILFGVHQFVIHPLLVWRAWQKIYKRRPTLKELLCIFLHDIGYVGKPNMDGTEGESHPFAGARIANRLLGNEYALLVLYHSRAVAKHHNSSVSDLCLPDKLATLLYPTWLYLLLGTMSGEINEYKERMGMKHLSHAEWLWEVKYSLYQWATIHVTEEEHPRLVNHFSRKVPAMDVVPNSAQTDMQ